jgi:hypothetical protein
MTLPAASAVKHLSSAIAAAGLTCVSGEEEAFVLTMDGPFEQKTGGERAFGLPCLPRRLCEHPLLEESEEPKLNVNYPDSSRRDRFVGALSILG